MLALAAAFHWAIANDAVTPNGYADNWGWSTFNFEHHKVAFISTVNFTNALRLQIDFEKAGIGPSQRNFEMLAWSCPLCFLTAKSLLGLKPM
jgi:hypothetical protein